MRGIQNALIVASTIQIVIGLSGLWRNVTRLLSPLSAISSISLAGFGLYELGSLGVSTCKLLAIDESIMKNRNLNKAASLTWSDVASSVNPQESTLRHMNLKRNSMMWT
ncbi:hypothetical protein Scep_004127 [Stephania cephalantha]|uniref:Uncharacterized protein n=1 Tax=Stephania cephalantha TaxID=152367 RepID=A0AAP0PV49_9MAGN